MATPYKDWETPQLQSYLKSKGADTKKAADTNKNSLVNSVKSYWTDSADSATESYHSVKDWIFDRYSLTSLNTYIVLTVYYAVGPTLS